MANVLERLRAMTRGEVPQPPVAQLLGFRLMSISTDEAIVELDVAERHANPMGTIHGGILCDIADAAMGLAYAATLGADEDGFTSLELKINFLKAVRGGRLRAIGRVVHAGHTIGLVEGDVVNQKGELVARASSTFMTIRAKTAHARQG